MNSRNLDMIRQRGEGLSVEFKRCGNGIQSDTYETVCSFLNRFGGDIFLGVDDDGAVIGLPESSIQPMIKNFISMVGNSNFLNPPFYLEPEDIIMNGHHVLHVYVPPSSDVHRLKGICYDRINDSDVKVTGTDQIAEMYIRKHNLYTEKRIYPFLTKAELRLDLIPKIREMALAKFPEHPWGRIAGDDDFLRSAGLWETDYATNQTGYNAAAVLLLGKDDVIRSVFPAYETDALLRRVNVDRYDDREIIRTNLIESYFALVDFGRKHLPDKFYLDEEGQNISLRGRILREMIANVLIHREFSSPYPAKFVIEKERMYIENANKALRHGMITPDTLQPFPKNPLIAAFFREIGLADKLGSGVRNLFKYSRPYSGADPVFLEEDVFRIIVPLDDQYSPAEEQAGTSSMKSSQNASQIVSQKILDMLADRPQMTTDELGNALGVSRRTIMSHIKKLKDGKRLCRIGSDRSGHWEVIKQEDNKHD